MPDANLLQKLKGNDSGLGNLLLFGRIRCMINTPSNLSYITIYLNDKVYKFDKEFDGIIKVKKGDIVKVQYLFEGTVLYLDDVFINSLPSLDLHGEIRDSARVLVKEFIYDNYLLKNNQNHRRIYMNFLQ